MTAKAGDLLCIRISMEEMIAVSLCWPSRPPGIHPRFNEVWFKSIRDIVQAGSATAEGWNAKTYKVLMRRRDRRRRLRICMPRVQPIHFSTAEIMVNRPCSEKISTG